jgi:hypothetical protein
MAGIIWHKAAGESSIPKGRRLLLIATPLNMPHTDLLPDVVVGHWHESLSAFVPAEIPYPREGARPELNVLLWAEIPAPEGVDLRPLALEDQKG